VGGAPTLVGAPVSCGRETVAVGLALGLAAVLRVPSLGQPLLEHHWFRQTQTAYTARLFYEQGVDLFHPRLPVLGPPFEVPFEFPLFQALATLPMHLGAPADWALRLTSLLCFLGTGLFLWGVLRRLAGGAAALAGLVFFLYSPFALVWSRTSMIEYLATAGAVGYVWAGTAWRDHGRPWRWGAAVLAGLVAMLVKPTTGLFWLLPFVAYVAAHDTGGVRGWIRVRSRPSYVALLVIPVASALLWTWHADSIKAASPATTWLTSQALQTWNFGTLPQRLEFTTWLGIAARIEETLVGTPFLCLFPMAMIAAVRSRQSVWWGALGLAAILPVAVFFNLYVVHDYYLAAITPALAAFLGLGAATVWEYQSRMSYRALLVLAALSAAALLGMQSRGYWSPIYRSVSDPSHALPLARELVASSRPDDLVVVAGRDWSPDVLYYARRFGLMLAPSLVRPDLVGRLPADPYRIMASFNPHVDPLWVLRAWPWTGVLGPRVYVMGNVAGDLRGAPLLATDDGNAYTAARAEGHTLVTAPVAIRCGVPNAAEIPQGTKATWLRLRPEAVRSPARIYLANGLAPLPARSVIAVGAPLGPDRTRLRLACLGASTVTVEEVTDAALPLPEA
jgi:Dolichyl-phosphate-mannose-protein mannosyltransferase